MNVVEAKSVVIFQSSCRAKIRTCEILLIEDNRRLSDALRRTLVEDGYVVDTAYDGVEGEDLALITSYSLIILDVMLPKRDGIEVCRSLRDQHVATPILMLTARTRSTTALPAWIAVPTIISSSRSRSRNYALVCAPCSAANQTTKAVCFKSRT